MTDNAPMNPMHMHIFQTEGLLQCKAILLEGDEIGRALDSPSRRDTAILSISAVDQVWVALQNLLVAAANISKLLLGQGREGYGDTCLLAYKCWRYGLVGSA